MKKKTKIVFVLALIISLLSVIAFFVFLVDINSWRYKTAFIITMICLVLVWLDFLFIYQEEKRELRVLKNEEYEFLPFKRDYLNELRLLMFQDELENSTSEASRMQKVEEETILLEKKRNVYLVKYKGEAKALAHVIINRKNKEFSITLEYGSELDIINTLVLLLEKEGYKKQD